MTYSQGGLIQATDYNNFVNGSNQINTIWNVGNATVGYGQTALSTVAATNTVTATQWASLINTVNSIKTHQTGSGTGLTAPTAGSTIAYLSAVGGNINTAYTNALTAASQGSTTTGTALWANLSYAATTGTDDYKFTRTITFASADQARYFFNAGGQINFVNAGATAADSSGRSADIAFMVNAELGSINAIKAVTNGGRTGTGGTVNTANTAVGYYTLTAANTAVMLANVVTANTTYSGDFVSCALRSSGTSGSHFDNGATVYLDVRVVSNNHAAQANTAAVNWAHRVDVVYPETTNLTNVWGTVTVS